MLAALMSTVAAALNSCATLVALDIVKRIKPQTSDQIQVRVGQISAVVVMILALLWSTQGSRYSSIFEAVNVIAAELAPPITTVFVWGVFWRRGTKEAALTTLIFGFVLGVLGFLFDLPVIGSQKVITDRWGIPFMMQAWWAFCLCSAVYVATSLVTPPPPREVIMELTWKNPWACVSSRPIESLTDPRVLAASLLVVMAALYIVFR
jgi:SSS family solute:Na+ symporter